MWAAISVILLLSPIVSSLSLAPPGHSRSNGTSAGKSFVQSEKAVPKEADLSAGKECSKNCMNGGTFNAPNCYCECPIGYHGERCEGPKWKLAESQEDGSSSDCDEVSTGIGPSGYSLERCLEAAEKLGANTVNYKEEEATCLPLKCSNSSLELTAAWGGFDVYVYSPDASDAPVVPVVPVGPVGPGVPVGPVDGLPSLPPISPPTGYNPCGSLHYASHIVARPYWIMCYLKESDGYTLARTDCEDLIKDVGYSSAKSSDSAALLAAGGNFGCWRVSSSVDQVSVSGACKDGFQHTSSMKDYCSSCTVFGVCIRLAAVPSATTTTTTTPTPAPYVGSSSVCGDYLRHATSFVARTGWTMCYLKKGDGRDTTDCKYLIKNVGSGSATYSDSSALKTAGGNFGCWRVRTTVSDVSSSGACKDGFQHDSAMVESYCTDCAAFGVCIRLPTAPSTTPAPAPYVGSSSVCGDYLRHASSFVARTGWTMCYLMKGDGRDTTDCEDLIKNVGSGSATYSDSSALKTAGGNFGCWRVRTTVSDVSSTGACKDGFQHDSAMVESWCTDCAAFGVCIRFPTVPVIAPTSISSTTSPCGDYLHHAPHIVTPTGWTMCYLKSGDDRDSTDCKYLLKNVGYSSTSTYSSYTSLMSAGGNFGCWRWYTTVEDVKVSSACRDNYQHTSAMVESYCTTCKVFGVCIRLP